jgi:hypothetical protein
MTLSKRYCLIFCALIALSLSSGNAFATSSDGNRPACAGVNTEAPQALKYKFAGLVAAAVGQDVKLSQVTIETFLSSGSWSMVYAVTPVADPGYFFFQLVDGQERFADVWGGMAGPSDRPELIAWAKKLGAPNNLAACFAHVVID